MHTRQPQAQAALHTEKQVAMAYMLGKGYLCSTHTNKYMTRIAVFASGNGSNCQNIIETFQHTNDICVALVVCNNAQAQVISRANRLGVATTVISRAELANANVMLPLLEQHHIDFIVLAGFLLMIPPYLTASYNGRMVNLHPSLLPRFGGKGMYGRHVHEAVKAAQVQVTGITIHWVTPQYDEGNIIAQRTTAVLPTDTVDDIASKVHELEMQHVPSIIQAIIRGEYR